MTSTSDKVRGLFLAALMVMSVFAGTIAFSGSSVADVGNDATLTGVSPASDPGDVTINANDDATDISSITQTVDTTVNVEDGTENYILVDVSDATDTGLELNGVSTSGTSADLSANVESTSDEEVNISLSADGSNSNPETFQVEFDWDASDAENDNSVPMTFEPDSGGNAQTLNFKVVGDYGTLVQATETDTIFVEETVQFRTGGGSDSGTDVGVTVYDENTDDSNNLGSVVANLNTDMSDRINYDTGNLETGENYYVVFGGNEGEAATMNTIDLGLTAEADSQSVTTEENIVANVESNDPSGDYTAYLYDSGDNEEASTTGSLDGGGAASVEFSGDVDTGNYTVEVEHNETGITAETDEVEVVEAGDEDANFGSDAYINDEVGDVAEIPIQLENTDTADVRIGTMNDGYVINATVEDEGDGEVTLLFNTFTAGSTADGDVSDSDVLSVDTEDEEDSISNIEENGDFASNTAGPRAGLLDPAQYEIVADTGAGDDLGTLDLNERSTGNMSIWTAPEDESVNDWGAADYWNNEGSSVTETDAVADQDYAVHAVEATGLEGAFDYYDNESDLLASDNGMLFNLTVEQTNPGPNRDAKVLNFDDAATIQPDAANDTYFVSVDMGDASTDERTLDTGDEYQANFTVDSDGVLDAGDDDASGNYEVVERNGELDTTDSMVHVQAASGQEISGETSIAPGSEVTVRVSSSDADSPFRFNPSTTVNADGTFNVSIDFSDEDTGTNFTASVIDPYTNSAFDDADAVEGQISDEVPTDTPTPDDSDNGTDTPTDDGDATATETDGMTPTPTETPTGPGFGVVLAIFAMLGAALLAARRNA